MAENKRHFNLSYGMEGVVWDGKQLVKKSDAEIRYDIDCMREAGMTEIMISSYHLEEPSSFNLDAETRRIGRELETRGMKANQHHGYAACLARPGNSRKTLVENLKACIDFSANLHADHLVLHLGKVEGHYKSMAEEKQAFQSILDRCGTDAVMDQIAETMQEAGDYARKNNLRIALENLDAFHHLSNIDQLPELLKRIDHPNVGACLDFGHAHCAGISPIRWIRTLGPKLFTTHIHDNHGNVWYVKPGELVDATPEFDEHLTPGLGTIPWTECITALWEINYPYTLSFESSWPGVSGADRYRYSKLFWRAAEDTALRRLNYNKKGV